MTVVETMLACAGIAVYALIGTIFAAMSAKYCAEHGYPSRTAIRWAITVLFLWPFIWLAAFWQMGRLTR